MPTYVESAGRSCNYVIDTGSSKQRDVTYVRTQGQLYPTIFLSQTNAWVFGEEKGCNLLLGSVAYMTRWLAVIKLMLTSALLHPMLETITDVPFPALCVFVWVRVWVVM